MSALTGETPVDRGDMHVAAEDEEEGDGKEVVKTEAEDQESEEERAEREEKEKAAADEAEKVKRIRIPKSRVDEMVGKERAKVEILQKKLDEALSAVKNKEVSSDVRIIQNRIDQLEEEMEGFRADGKKAELVAARHELRDLQDVLIEHRINERAGQAKEAAKTEFKYDVLVEQIEKDFPELNPDHEDYDDEKAGEVLELRDGFAKNGVPAYEALRRAMKYVMGDRQADKTVARADDRAEKARGKALDASKKQPANLKGAGFDSDKAGGGTGEARNVLKMDQKEFAKLSEEQRRSMRGDDI